MSTTPLIGQVQMFAGNFAPRGWAFCEGQLLAIASNTALFSILGTTYGGDGRTTFGLPDLRGRTPIGAGRGPGLSNYRLGQSGGAESHTLSTATIPSHRHSITTLQDTAPGETATPETGLVSAEASEDIYGPGTSAVVTAHVSSRTGGALPVIVRAPYLSCYYIIALIGIYPSRS